MTNIVNQSDRLRAHELARSILRHLLDRIWDAQQITRNAKTPDDAIRECSEISELARQAHQAAYVWKALYLDYVQHEPEVKSQPAEQEVVEVQIEKEESI